MRMAWMGLLCLMATGVAWGADSSAAQQQIEASLDVSGSLAVDDKGNVTSHTIDHPEKLSPGVVGLIGKTIPTLHFKPVLRDGQPHAVEANMYLVLVANHVDAQNVSIRIRSARFTESEPPSSGRVRIRKRGEVQFPSEAMREGLGGTVYVAVRIGRNGRVMDAQAQQVNLRKVGSEEAMHHWRDVLSKPTLAAIRKFTFRIPSTGPEADHAEFSGILPVIFNIGQGQPRYGQWNSYVPGPRESITWYDDKEDTRSSEAVPPGTFAQAGTALTLLTPLGDG
jgi:hypothetical protein